MKIQGTSEFYPDKSFFIQLENDVLSIIHADETLSEVQLQSGSSITYPVNCRIADSTNLEIIFPGVYLCLEPLHIGDKIINTSVISVDENLMIKCFSEVQLSQKQTLPIILKSTTLMYIDFGRISDSRWNIYGCIDYNKKSSCLILSNNSEKISRAILPMKLKS